MSPFASRLARFLVGWSLIAGAAVRADLITNVPEAADYSLVYQLAIPTSSGLWNTNVIPYSVDNSGSFPAGSFDRVAYYLELSGSTNPGSPNGWVFVSFDRPAVFTDATKIGVPSRGPNGSKVVSNTTVANLTVRSNVAGVVTGDNMSGGKIEFWGSNYSPGANSVHDYDDSGFGTSAGYGSMQVHNVAATDTIFAFNRFGNSGGTDVGIGNRSTGSPDWTFAANGGHYTTRNLQVLVYSAVPEPTSLVLCGVASLAGAASACRRRWKRRNHRTTVDAS